MVQSPINGPLSLALAFRCRGLSSLSVHLPARSCASWPWLSPAPAAVNTPVSESLLGPVFRYSWVNTEEQSGPNRLRNGQSVAHGGRTVLPPAALRRGWSVFSSQPTQPACSFPIVVSS